MKKAHLWLPNCLFATLLCLALLAVGCAGADEQVTSSSVPVESISQSESPEADAPEVPATTPPVSEVTEIVCAGQVVPVATATVASVIPPPPVEGDDNEPGDFVPDPDVDESLFPTPTPEPTPEPAPVATRLDGGFGAAGAVPAPADLEPGTSWVRIGDTDHVGTGVYFDEGPGLVRVSIGQGSRVIEFNLEVDEVGVPSPIRVGSTQPSTVYGGDAVAKEFEVADGPGANEVVLTWKGDVAAGLPAQEQAGSDIWVAGTFDISVCEFQSPIGHRMTGSFNLKSW